MFPSIEPAEVGATGLLWLVLSYGYVLFHASNLISEGSDLLLLVPSLAGLVGGVVLPLLGAVPDGAIMLFSGIGNIETAQETLSVGVGALAGSTIMLLTIPWGFSVLAGRVDIHRLPSDDGGGYQLAYLSTPKLQPKSSLRHQMFDTGVAIAKEVRHGGLIMLITTIPYLMIQIPASFLHGPSEDIAKGEKWWALLGLLVCVSGFVTYLLVNIRASKNDEAKIKRLEILKDKLRNGDVSLSGAFHDIIKTYGTEQQVEGYGSMQYQSNIKDERLHRPTPKVKEYLSETLRGAFSKYDIDDSNTLQKSEMRLFMRDLHEEVSESEVDALFAIYDKDGNGVITFDEFVDACYNIMLSEQKVKSGLDREYSKVLRSFSAKAVQTMSSTEDGNEEIPTEMSHLSPEEQQRRIKRKAFGMLALGTLLVLVFSDPMVDCMQEIANRFNISPFYVSFILAPIASNASEVIASTYYAAKKTRKSITVSFTALEGAASMNNTFCLSIFMGLIFFRGLAWEYSAETVTILLVQVALYVITRTDKMTTLHGVLVLLIFPLSIALVALLEKYWK